MVRHIVLWLKSPDEDDFARIREALERRFASGRRGVDFALLCDFESRAALGAYHRHPAHQETRAVVDPLVAEH